MTPWVTHKAFRVCIQNVAVWTATTRSCWITCAHVASIHVTFECTQWGVLSLYRAFSACHTTRHTPHHTTPHTWRHSNTQHTPHHTKKEDIEWLRGRQEKEDRDRDRRYDEWEHNTRQDKTRQGKMKETKTEIMMWSDAERKFTQEKAKRANSNPPGINIQKKWES